MYKVFINEKRILLTNIFNNIFSEPNMKIIRYVDKRSLLSEIEHIENGITKENTIIFESENIEALRNDFISLHKLIHAAGGVVRNEGGEILFIYRLNRWDLPKGKIEIYEDAQEAAIREVIEETNLRNPHISKELSSTFHTYRKGNERILKKTRWFEMRVSGEQNPIPQTKEKITDVRWFSVTDIQTALKSTYSSIQDLLYDYLSG